jgi:predicted AlkP superfamily phosphohydrolase/phosphomutase
VSSTSSNASRLPWLLLVPVVSLVDLGVAAEGLSRGAGERASRRADDADTIPRIVVLGFDGVDPGVVAEYLKAGELPAIRALVERGGLHNLQSEIPPESPVAWASLQTGVKPGRHGIFDFIGRDPERSGYRPTNGMVDFEPPPFLFGVVPTRPPRIESRLAFPTFLERVSEAGYGVLGLRPPLAFPARPHPDERLLTGLGTPDLAGTNGAYAYYDSNFTTQRPEYTVFNGHRILLEGGPSAVAFDTYLEGPYDRRRRDAHGGFPRLTVPLRFERILPDGPVNVVLDGERAVVAVGELTPWMRVGFHSKTFPSFAFRGLVRFRVQNIEPLQVLTDPVQIDPSDPALPIATPAGFAAELVDEGGPYSTTGWLEPTFPYNDGLMAPEMFMKHVLELMNRDHGLLLGELMRPARRSTRPAPLVFHVFTETDRTSHCFWWLRDTDHPAYDKQIAARLSGLDPILEIYRRMDHVIADAVARLGEDDTLLVVSDHGFQSFRYGFSVNQWLLNEGYLVMKSGADADPGTLSAFFGESLSTDDVDWSKTRAYALGLGQIYVNRRGREPQGIVAPEDVAALVAELRAKIVAFVDKKHDNALPIRKAYDLSKEYGDGPAMTHAAEIQLGFGKNYRVSWQTALLRDIRLKGTDPIDDNTNPWSGDHCSTDRDLVPGFLLSNRPLPVAPAGAPYNVRDIAATVLSHFHIDTSDLDGTPLPLGR